MESIPSPRSREIFFGEGKFQTLFLFLLLQRCKFCTWRMESTVVRDLEREKSEGGPRSREREREEGVESITSRFFFEGGKFQTLFLLFLLLHRCKFCTWRIESTVVREKEK